MPIKTRVQPLQGLDRVSLLKAHRLMYLARSLDEAELKLRRHQKSFFEISGAGHEAFQAAAALLLKPGHDWFYPYYRDRTLCLGLGITPRDMLLQSLGRAADPSSGGREMPAHYGSPTLHVVNQSSPTGTQYLQAVGTAEATLLARQIEARESTQGQFDADQLALVPRHEKDEITYVSGGEGSASEGEFFEALCVASMRKLPVLFAIEDNEYAISVPGEFQTPGGNVSALVRGFPHFYIEEVNGLDLLQSYQALKRAIAYVRSGMGPALIHAHVIRLWPHSDSDDDRLYRPRAEKDADRARDPLPALEELLVGQGFLKSEELEEIHRQVKEEVERAVQCAQECPPPDPATATQFVFNPVPALPGKVEPQAGGAPMAMIEAINRTLEREMRRDPRILVFGEDVADVSRIEHLAEVSGKGGVFKVTHNLQRKFGEHRVFNTPIAEAAIVGRAFGLAVRGFLPVAEIQFFDYVWPAMQQLRNELSVLRWRSNNTFSAPVVLRIPIGGYLVGGGLYHSQSGESIFCHCPGLRVVMPSNARDAAGLLRAALRCGDPVLFLEHKHLYRQRYAQAPDPGEDYVVPLGKARIARPGRDLTLITYGALVEKSLRAAEEIANDGIDTEVIDLRSLQPYDWDTLRSSILRTSRAVVAYEDQRTHGFGAEISARIGEELFAFLDAPVGRVAGLDVPVGYSPALEQATLPQVADIAREVRRICAF